MFLHKHPYQPFVKSDTTKLIVGTLPPPRFSTGQLNENDVDFCYGSYHNSLWKFIDKIYKLELKYDNSDEAIQQRKEFLIQHKIGICDIVESTMREKIDASDLGMTQIKLRNVMEYLRRYTKIETILFIGGNSKNGPEYFFRKQLKSQQLKLELLSNEIPRIHQFALNGRMLKTVSLTSSSGAANISISKLPLYKQLKAKDASFNTFDFRVMQYREFI